MFREGYPTFYLVNRLLRSFLLLVSLVLKTKTVVIRYLALNFIATVCIEYYSIKRSKSKKDNFKPFSLIGAMAAMSSSSDSSTADS